MKEDKNKKYISIIEKDDTFIFDAKGLTYFEIVGILTHFRDHIQVDRIQHTSKIENNK